MKSCSNGSEASWELELFCMSNCEKILCNCSYIMMGTFGHCMVDALKYCILLAFLLSSNQQCQCSKENSSDWPQVTVRESHLLALSFVDPPTHFWAPSLLSNRHYRSNGDCLEGKRENIRSVLYNIVHNNCVQCNAHTYEQTNSSLDWVLSHWAHFTVLTFLGHRLGDDLVDWNSGVSVRPSVRPQKVFPISI